MIHINLPEEEIVDITAELASELSIKGRLLVVAFTVALISKLEEATAKKIPDTEHKAPEIINAGLWKIIISEHDDSTTQLVMMWRDHVRVDRLLDNKHKALECAFNILVN